MIRVALLAAAVVVPLTIALLVLPLDPPATNEPEPSLGPASAPSESVSMPRSAAAASSAVSADVPAGRLEAGAGERLTASRSAQTGTARPTVVYRSSMAALAATRRAMRIATPVASQAPATAVPQLMASDPLADPAIARQLGRVPSPTPTPEPPKEQPPDPAPGDDAALGRQAIDAKLEPSESAGFGAGQPLTLPKARVDLTSWEFAYAKATRSVPVYESPGGVGPQRTLDPTGRWEAVTESVAIDGTTWLRLASGGWSPDTALEVAPLPPFAGVELRSGRAAEIGFVVTDILNVRPRPGLDDDNEPVAQIERYDAVAIDQEMEVAGEPWYRIGDGAWVSGAYIRRIPWADRPAGVSAGEKWIDVNLTRQTLVAYRDAVPAYATLVSSGLPRTPTWTGLSRIWIKYLSARMAGGDRSIPGDYYWLEHVPYTMYFHWDFGLHGAYWHNDFGRQKSHGCVNLSPTDAAWLFEWTDVPLEPGERVARPSSADPGTWVWTHY